MSTDTHGCTITHPVCCSRVLVYLTVMSATYPSTVTSTGGSCKGEEAG